MSIRSLIEINHDLPRLETEAQMLEFGRRMSAFVANGDPRNLPSGLKKLSSRHHSEPYPGEPLKDLP